MVKWQELNSLVSPGLLIETLIICILCDRKPLWKVEQFWAEQDLAHLFPHTGLTYGQLNDDAYGHALDKLSEIDQSLLISLVSLTLLQAHDLQISSLHLDTTSKSVQGAYTQKKSEDFQWQSAGILAETTTRATASYQLYSTREPLNGREYRFVVVQSSALEAKKEKTLRKRAALRQAHWEKLAKQLDSQVFACAADAQTMLTGLQQQIAKEHFHFEGTVLSEETKTYPQKGRPKKGEQPQTQTIYRTQCAVGEMNTAVWEDWKRKESTFILITTELDEERNNNLWILTEYKQQIGVENRFRVLKDPVYLGPIYLKNEKRIQALGYVFILVLLLACYLEYRVRTKLKQLGGAVKLPGNKKTATPSVMTILEILETIHVVSIGGVRYFPDNMNREALRMIEWAGFTQSIYLQPLPNP